MTHTPEAVLDDGRWSLPVSWDQVDELRLRLAGVGFPTVACLNPMGHIARLELPPGADPAAAAAALAAVMTDGSPAGGEFRAAG